MTAAASVKKLIDNEISLDKPVLVSGVTGGVGSIGINLLSNLGAKVTAITGKMDKKNLLEELGATTVLDRGHFVDTTRLPLDQGKFHAALDVVVGTMGRCSFVRRNVVDRNQDAGLCVCRAEASVESTQEL